MNVKLYLKDPKKKGETSIIAKLTNGFYSETLDGKRKYRDVKVLTGKKIDPVNWNVSKGRAKQTSKFNNYPEFNSGLDDIENDIKKVFDNLSNQLRKEKKHVTPELFKKEWELYNNPTPPETEPEKVEFVEFAESFIKKSAANRTETTLKNYRNSLRHLKEFAEYKNIDLTFDGMTLDFFLDFLEYLKTQKKFATNTIWRIVKVLKVFMNESLERKLHSNLNHKSTRFTVKPELPETVYLNENELMTLWETDFSNNKKLERVRDLFLIGCFTGLRFSDLSRLTHDNIIEFEGVKMLNIRTKKTGEVVSVPLHYIVVEILERYGGKIPKAISNQKFNDYIKDICRETGLVKTITIEKTQGNLTAPKHFEKWELISTHTARRSFATNMYLAGFDPISIRKITGHRTEKSFLSYIRLTGKENALVMSKHEYFKKPLKIAK